MSGRVRDDAVQLRDESRETLTFQILGVRFHRYTRRQAVEQILHWMAEKSPRMVITAGPEFVMMAKQQPEVLRMAQRADLVTPDGIGVVSETKVPPAIAARVRANTLTVTWNTRSRRFDTSPASLRAHSTPNPFTGCYSTVNHVPSVSRFTVFSNEKK